MILREGGNAFKDPKTKEPLTQDIDQTDVKPTVLWLEQLTGLSLMDNLLGSTGLKPQSGDIDIAVDKSQTSKSKLVNILSTYVKSHGLEPGDFIKGGGGADKAADQFETISFRAPIAGNPDRGEVQVDFMLEPDISWAKFSKRAAAKTNYSDSMKHIVLSAIAKSKISPEHPEGFTWSGQYGLQDRKTKELITKDPAEIATLLFGPKGTVDMLQSVEGAARGVNLLPNNQALLQKLRDEFAAKNQNYPELAEDSPAWYRNMMGRLA